MTTALEDVCANIIRQTDARDADEVWRRGHGPIIRIWNGLMELQEVVRCEDDFTFTEIENDTGSGKLTFDGEMPIAQWLWDIKFRKDNGDKIDVFVSVDFMGVRWGGRLNDCVLRTDEMGNSLVEAIFEHDFQQLKKRDLWATPSTPANFQPIKVHMLGGPTPWALGTSLWLNLARAHGNPVGWHGDPLSVTTADYTAWPMVISPDSYAAARARGAITGLVISRFKTWFEAAESMLYDSGITTRVQRYLPGDSLPWTGARISYGTLVVWFEDNSGGLANNTSGSIGEGIDQLARIWLSSLVEGMGGGSLPIEEGEQAATGQPIPPAYQVPGYIGTDPKRPYVLYTVDSPGMASVEAHIKPATVRRLTSGGSSAPMVNELLEAAVAGIGDALAAIPFVPPLGGVANALLKPFYTDVLMAFMTVYLSNRASYASRFGLYEEFLSGADKAYTLSSTMVMRSGMQATASQFSAKFEIIDSAPYSVGDGGKGDMHLGTRIMMQIPGDQSGRIYSERIRSLELSGSRGNLPEFKAVVGDLEPNEDPLQKSMRKIAALLSGLKQSGLM